MTIPFKDALVVSHIVFRKIPPYDNIEGPYSSVCEALTKSGFNVSTLFLPLNGLELPVIFGPWKKSRRVKLPGFLGRISVFKYTIDIIFIGSVALKFIITHPQKTFLIVGIDPLSNLPLAALKRVFGFKLIFYSVDFNRNRFTNRLLQFLYEESDRFSSQWSDQTWVVCESLKEYKQEKYGVNSIYIPNSSVFDRHLYEEGRPLKTGNKLVWSGAFLTERSFNMFFDLLKDILAIRNDLEFYFAPTRDHDKFRKYIKDYQFTKASVLELTSRRTWQEFAATGDVGIAIYDDRFGSTEFIEPLKIWDYLMCGLPFIISGEPSLSTFIKNSGVAYILAPHNQIGDVAQLKEFLKKERLQSLQTECLRLAEEFDIQKQIKLALLQQLQGINPSPSESR